MDERPLLPERQHVRNVTRDASPNIDSAVLSTCDPEVIRQWAKRVGAEPATGQESVSGSSVSMKVADGGSGLRFNFPGVSRFREISWAEWFSHFTSHDLTFVYDNAEGHSNPSARFRIVRTVDLHGIEEAPETDSHK